MMMWPLKNTEPWEGSIRIVVTDTYSVGGKEYIASAFTFNLLPVTGAVVLQVARQYRIRVLKYGKYGKYE